MNTNEYQIERNSKANWFELTVVSIIEYFLGPGFQLCSLHPQSDLIVKVSLLCQFLEHDSTHNPGEVAALSRLGVLLCFVVLISPHYVFFCLRKLKSLMQLSNIKLIKYLN